MLALLERVYVLYLVDIRVRVILDVMVLLEKQNTRYVTLITCIYMKQTTLRRPFKIVTKYL